ncbi:MAG: hypothetical protein QM644_14950 [Mobilitalea sp.]
MNTITASAAVLMMISNYVETVVHFVGLSLFTFYGYGIALISILPNIQLSDGAFLKELENTRARGYNRKQLLIAKQLMDGYTYKELPEEVYVVCDREDLTNSIIGYHKILESYYYMDRKEWDKAKKALMNFDKVIDDVPKSIRNIVAAEKMFLSLLENNVSFTEDKELEDYLNGKGDINFHRVKTAYSINKDNQEKERYRKIFIRNMKDYAYPGEAAFCHKLLEEIQ